MLGRAWFYTTAFVLLTSAHCLAGSRADSGQVDGGQKDGWRTESQAIMGTEISVTLWHPDDKTGRKAIAAVMDEMHRIDRALSPYIDTSELFRVNQLAARTPQEISDEFVMLVDKSLYFSRTSEGAFDITFASVGWKYDYRNKQQPSDEERQSLLPAINYQLLRLDKNKKTLYFGHPDIRIDLGGIAKGYAVDRAVELLQARGVEHATVSAGGDSRVMGDKMGRPWIVGIKNPRAGENRDSPPVIRLPLTDTAVSTSGDYERYFIDEFSGERIHHIINPKTGKSATGVISVTVLGPKGVDTDPLSTTVFVLGVEKGLKLVNRLQGIDCVIIDSSGKVHFSTGLSPPESSS